MKIYLIPIIWGLSVGVANAQVGTIVMGETTETVETISITGNPFANTAVQQVAVEVDEDVPIDVTNLAAVNSLIDKYHAREVEPGSMHDQLRALRGRVLADPFPIPQEVEHGSLFDMAIGMAAKYDIPKQLFFNLVTAESNWDPVITSHRGAIGLTQLMPGTAEELGVDPWDTYENLEGGARYLSQQYRSFGSWELALAAYNAGPGAVRKHNGIPPFTETQEYVEKILKDFDGNEALQLENVLDVVLGEATPTGG